MWALLRAPTGVMPPSPPEHDHAARVQSRAPKVEAVASPAQPQGPTGGGEQEVTPLPGPLPIVIGAQSNSERFTAARYCNTALSPPRTLPADILAAIEGLDGIDPVIRRFLSGDETVDAVAAVDISHGSSVDERLQDAFIHSLSRPSQRDAWDITLAVLEEHPSEPYSLWAAQIALAAAPDERSWLLVLEASANAGLRTRAMVVRSAICRGKSAAVLDTFGLEGVLDSLDADDGLIKVFVGEQLLDSGEATRGAELLADGARQLASGPVCNDQRAPRVPPANVPPDAVALSSGAVCGELFADIAVEQPSVRGVPSIDWTREVRAIADRCGGGVPRGFVTLSLVGDHWEGDPDANASPFTACLLHGLDNLGPPAFRSVIVARL